MLDWFYLYSDENILEFPSNLLAKIVFVDSRKEGPWSSGNIPPQYKTASIKLQWDIFTIVQKKRHLSHECENARFSLPWRLIFLKIQDTGYQWCFLRDEIRIVYTLKNRAIKCDQFDAEKYSFPYVRRIFSAASNVILFKRIRLSCNWKRTDSIAECLVVFDTSL